MSRVSFARVAVAAVAVVGIAFASPAAADHHAEAGAKGAEMKGSATKGSGTKGSGTKAMETKGSGTKGSGTKGSGTKGSGTKGMEMKGSGTKGSGTKAAMAPSADIVDTAAAAGQFNTLIAAAKAAELAGALKGPGPLTVFAPTDDAFAKLPAGTVESLLLPENKGKLQNILKYHVVPGKLDASAVTAVGSLTTLNGQLVGVSVQGGAVKVGGADVVATDVMASNGVIHVIGAVMLPPPANTMMPAHSAPEYTAPAPTAHVAPGSGPCPCGASH